VTIETSHGKARPGLVRASDLPTVESARKPSDGRGSDGRFAPGNRLSVGAGFKRTAKKLLGTGTGSDEERVVRRDAWRVFVATMATMPTDAAPVRSLVSLHARHVALAAVYTAKAAEAGLGTATSLRLQEAADRQSQRAERVLVTALDVAVKLAPKSRQTSVAAMRARVQASIDAGSEAKP
jgi:hypothetical protein